MAKESGQEVRTMSKGENRELLSATETKIMKYIWSVDEEVFAADIITYFHREYQKEYARQTVNTFLKNLVNKGFLVQGVEYKQRTGHGYTCLISEEEYTRKMLSRYKKIHFDGSALNFIVSLLKTQDISKEDREQLKGYIEKMDS